MTFAYAIIMTTICTVFTIRAEHRRDFVFAGVLAVLGAAAVIIETLWVLQ